MESTSKFHLAPQEAAQELGISTGALNRLVCRGRIATVDMPGDLGTRILTEQVQGYFRRGMPDLAELPESIADFVTSGESALAGVFRQRVGELIQEIEIDPAEARKKEKDGGLRIVPNPAIRAEFNRPVEGRFKTAGENFQVFRAVHTWLPRALNRVRQDRLFGTQRLAGPAVSDLYENREVYAEAVQRAAQLAVDDVITESVAVDGRQVKLALPMFFVIATTGDMRQRIEAVL